MASHRGEKCAICARKGYKGHRLRHGEPAKKKSRSRSVAARKGWAKRRHITSAEERSRVSRKSRKGGARKSRKGSKSRKGRKRATKRRAAKR